MFRGNFVVFFVCMLRRNYLQRTFTRNAEPSQYRNIIIITNARETVKVLFIISYTVLLIKVLFIISYTVLLIKVLFIISYKVLFIIGYTVCPRDVKSYSQALRKLRKKVCSIK